MNTSELIRFCFLDAVEDVWQGAERLKTKKADGESWIGAILTKAGYYDKLFREAAQGALAIRAVRATSIQLPEFRAKWDKLREDGAQAYAEVADFCKKYVAHTEQFKSLRAQVVAQLTEPSPLSEEQTPLLIDQAVLHAVRSSQPVNDPFVKQTAANIQSALRGCADYLTDSVPFQPMLEFLKLPNETCPEQLANVEKALAFFERHNINADLCKALGFGSSIVECIQRRQEIHGVAKQEFLRVVPLIVSDEGLQPSPAEIEEECAGTTGDLESVEEVIEGTLRTVPKQFFTDYGRFGYEVSILRSGVDPITIPKHTVEGLCEGLESFAKKADELDGPADPELLRRVQILVSQTPQNYIQKLMSRKVEKAIGSAQCPDGSQLQIGQTKVILEKSSDDEVRCIITANPVVFDPNNDESPKTAQIPFAVTFLLKKEAAGWKFNPLG